MMVEKYIKYLLFEHDCVVIPDFGGFIANYVSADVHPIRHTFTPPYKNIAFNEMLKLNDGLLVIHISNGERISREAAQKLVKEYTDSVKNEIRTKQTYTFEEIGTLYLNHEQKLQFEPENKINYLSDSFGLPELTHKPVERTTSYTRVKTKDRRTVATNEDEELILTNEPKKSRSRIWLAVLLPLLLVFVGGVGYFLLVDDGNTAFSSFNPFLSVNESAEKDTMTVDDSFLYSDSLNASPDSGALATTESWETTTENPVAEEPVVEVDPAETAKDVAPMETSTAENKPVTEPAPARPVAESTDEFVAVPSNPARYYVIVGGFSVEKNAYKLKSRLAKKGNHTTKVIVPKNAVNLTKVSFADYGTFADAATKAEELKADYPAVWVFKY